jgi:hypothetical protein
MVEQSIDGPEGKTTTTLTSFKDGEPDPALFKAPEGIYSLGRAGTGFSGGE